MLGERIASQSEVIRAIGLGDSPCNGRPRTERAHVGRQHRELLDAPAAQVMDLKAAQARGDQGRLMLGERIASQSEVIRAIASGCSPCCGGAHQGGAVQPDGRGGLAALAEPQQRLGQEERPELVGVDAVNTAAHLDADWQAAFELSAVMPARREGGEMRSRRWA